MWWQTTNQTKNFGISANLNFLQSTNGLIDILIQQHLMLPVICALEVQVLAIWATPDSWECGEFSIVIQKNKK